MNRRKSTKTAFPSTEEPSEPQIMSLGTTVNSSGRRSSGRIASLATAAVAHPGTPLSSSVTPSDMASFSGNSTARTSLANTPPPALLKAPAGMPGAAAMVGSGDSRNTAAPEKGLRNSKYALGSMKRKRDVISDSEEDDYCTEDDEAVARKLQSLFDQEDAAAKATAPKARLIKGKNSSKGKGKTPVKKVARTTAATTTIAAKPSASGLLPSDEPASMALRPIRSRSGARSVAKGPPPVEVPDSDDNDPLGLDQPPSDYESEPIDEYDSDGSVDSVESPAPPKKTKAAPTKAVSSIKKGVKSAAKVPTASLSETESEAVLTNSSSSGSEDEAPIPQNLGTAPLGDDESEGATQQSLATRRRLQRKMRRGGRTRSDMDRDRLVKHHPNLLTMWQDLENRPTIKTQAAASQPTNISRQLKPFQLVGLEWMKAMERTEYKGGILGDEMGLGKTIQAVSLIMSDFPAKRPSLVLVPPVALMQWTSEIASYTDGTLNTLVYHGTNLQAKRATAAQLKKYNVIMMSYNSLESMYRKQEKGFKRKDGLYKEKSVIHSIKFHRVILDEAHCIKTRTTTTAKACFALRTKYRWCLSGTPLQNRIGEFFSLVRFLQIRPFADYFCRGCPCSTQEWQADGDARCGQCKCASMQHVSVFNHEVLAPIQKFGHFGPGEQAMRKLLLLTEHLMLRRLKKDHTDSMELPAKETIVERQFFDEEENDFAASIMTSGRRKFDTYVAQGVLLNNYANIFGLIMQMRQVANHPDLILKRKSDGGQNVLVCCICDEPAEDAIRSRCRHDFCRSCASSYLGASKNPDCPSCHIPLSIDLDQPEMEQEDAQVKKSSIINRIKMENWTSSTKIELLVHELHKLRSDSASHKSIIFSQFTTMLQLVEWRLRRAGVSTVMLDGSMTPAQRQASIDHFMKNPDVECFLVSLRAGGVALNLTEASRVFIVDPWWNPAAEWQSADRAHRIGQTRPCVVTRLCIEDSVESRMVLIQEKKANMIRSTVNADDKALQQLSNQDLAFLFKGH